VKLSITATQGKKQTVVVFYDFQIKITFKIVINITAWSVPPIKKHILRCINVFSKIMAYLEHFRNVSNITG
jgi:hypothetical protein